MTKYKVVVPPTMDVGSYSCIVGHEQLGLSKEQEALDDYNNARDHDGLAPIKRMPNGTKYIKMSEDDEPINLTIEQTYVPRGRGNNPNAGQIDVMYKIKEWGYVFPTKEDAIKYIKEHKELPSGEIVRIKNKGE